MPLQNVTGACARSRLRISSTAGSCICTRMASSCLLTNRTDCSICEIPCQGGNDGRMSGMTQRLSLSEKSFS